MTRRVLPLLLIALVATGLTAETCLQWRCAGTASMRLESAAATLHGTTHGAQHAAHRGGYGATPVAHHVADAAAHACCNRTGLTRPPCCPAMQIGPEQPPPGAGRASDAVQIAAAQPMPFRLVAPAVVRHETPRRFDPGAPPGTLIEQHTSLLI